MKLNYHPPTSNNSVGTLLYNKLFMPDRVVARANTTEYGFSGVTSERNDSALCVCFNEMSALANGSKFSLDQICGISKLDREKTFNFEFFLGKLETLYLKNGLFLIIRILAAYF
jgi:hypothetical protein